MGDRVAPRYGLPRGGPATPSHRPRGPPGQLAEASADAGNRLPRRQQGDHRYIEP